MYEGEFERDLPHGEGRYSFANGSVYVGEFAKGHIHGEGHFEFQEVQPLSRSAAASAAASWPALAPRLHHRLLTLCSAAY
jgi:hypothetical protein